MDRRERYEDFNEALLAALNGWQVGIWTALPAIIDTFDPVAMTVTAKPAIKARVLDSVTGTYRIVSMPLLVDVPVCFPGGGGYTLTFPVLPGDEALIVFASRCIDAWWLLGADNGDGREPPEYRMHELSDGFAIVGVRSQPRVIPAISTNSTQLRSDSGATFIDVIENTITITALTQVIVNTETATINAETLATINAPDTVVTGTLTVEGLLTYQDGIAGFPGTNNSVISGNIIQTGGVMSSNGIVVETHEHSGVQAGSDVSGPPVP